MYSIHCMEDVFSFFFLNFLINFLNAHITLPSLLNSLFLSATKLPLQICWKQIYVYTWVYFKNFLLLSLLMWCFSSWGTFYTSKGERELLIFLWYGVVKKASSPIIYCVLSIVFPRLLPQGFMKEFWNIIDEILFHQVIDETTVYLVGSSTKINHIWPQRWLYTVCTWSHRCS